jgi:hypothetical protein
MNEEIGSTRSKYIPVGFSEISDFDTFFKKKSVKSESRYMNFSFYKAFMLSNPIDPPSSFSIFQKDLNEYFFSNTKNKENYINLLNSFSTHLYNAYYDVYLSENRGFYIKQKCNHPEDQENEFIDDNLIFSAYRAYCLAKPESQTRIFEFCETYRPVLQKMSSSFHKMKMYIVFNEEKMLFVDKNEIARENSDYDPRDVHYDLDINPIRDRYWDRKTLKRKYALKFKDSDEVSWVSSSLLSYDFKLKEYNQEHKVYSKKNPFIYREKRKYINCKIEATRVLDIGNIFNSL